MAWDNGFVFAGAVELCRPLAERLVAAGHKAAPSLEAADVVFTFCTAQDALEEVYFGGEGLVARAKKGAYLVDLSATTPAFAREVEALSLVSDLHAVEAPLYVRDITVPNAYGNADNLVALAAGQDDDVAAVVPLLSVLAATVETCGGAGDGQLTKCALTLQQALRTMGLVESDALCRATAGAGAAGQVAARITGLGGQSPQGEALSRAIEGDSFTSTYSVEVMMCELAAALAAADEANLIMPLAEAADYLLRLLATIGGVDRAPAALTLVYRDEDECARHGLDWARAEEAYAEFDDADEFDGYDDAFDEGCGEGHGAGHHHHHDDEFPFDDYSFN